MIPKSPILRRAAISWSRGRELSPQRVWPVLRASGGLEAAISASEEELSRSLRSPEAARALRRSVDDADSERFAAQLERAGISIVTAFDEAYPAPLLEIPDPPFVLFTSGNPGRMKLPAVAVVGSRGASRYGREVASRLARELSSAGVCVVSGLARGIDATAHEAAFDGPGGTIGVLGCGVDVDYPRENAGLKTSMREGGQLLVSEYLPGIEPQARHFPVRNRIIAGLSAGVVVVEASRRSGSLITARLAGDFGRDVFAVPGSVFSETSAGAHELLRDGAILCRGAEDVLAEIFPAIGVPAVGPSPSASAADLSAEARRLLETLLRDGDASADELGDATNLPAATVLAALFELEAAGLARGSGAGRFALAGRSLSVRAGREP